VPASRRTILLIATAVVLLAAFAVLPAPRLIVRRSPVVSDRIAGDVRRIAMAVEPDGSMHAALEVWTDSDWDIEYWSSITSLTPVARVVTKDLIEQRDAAIAMTGDRLALAWVDYDAKAKQYALQVTTKQRIDRDWAEPVTVSSGAAVIREPSVQVVERGTVLVGYVRGDVLAMARVAGGSSSGISLTEVVGARRPQISDNLRFPSIVYERRGRIEAVGSGSAVPRVLSDRGRAPVVRIGRRAWAEDDAIVYGDGVAAAERIPVPGLGDARPSIAITDGSADVGTAVAWSSGGVVRFLPPGGSTELITATRGCCASLAARNRRVWLAWLESKPGDAIERFVRLRYIGEPGRFTTGDRIPITALPATP